MKDVLVGVFSNHSWDQVRPWAESLVASGFEGDKIAVTYGVAPSVTDKLHSLGFDIHRKDIFDVRNRANIVVQRFFDVPDVLSDYVRSEHRLITTDVADVIFQRNPSEVLDKLIGDSELILASGEGLTYENEPWSQRNMKLTFGEEAYNSLREHEILCAGVIAGRMDVLCAALSDVYFKCQGLPDQTPGGGGPDQAAFNLLMRGSYRNECLVTGHNDEWAAQMGTTIHAVKAGAGDIGLAYANSQDKEAFLAGFMANSLWYQPEIVNGQVIGGHLRDPFAIVHQYNRVPELMLSNRKDLKSFRDVDNIYINTGATIKS